VPPLIFHKYPQPFSIDSDLLLLIRPKWLQLVLLYICSYPLQLHPLSYSLLTVTRCAHGLLSSLEFLLHYPDLLQARLNKFYYDRNENPTYHHPPTISLILEIITSTSF